MRARPALTALASLCAACAGSSPTEEAACSDRFAGTRGARVVVAPSQPLAAGGLAELVDDGELRLEAGDSSGAVAVVTFRAQNLVPATVQYRALLRDPDDGRVLSESHRNVPLRCSTSRAGWAEPASAASGNATVGACPIAAGRPLVGRTVWLDVTVDDEQGHKASVRRKVVPSCGGNAACEAACGVVRTDGGPSDGGPDDGCNIPDGGTEAARDGGPGFAGDPCAPVLAAVWQVNYDTDPIAPSEVSDGSSVSATSAPQGGFVLFVGAQATNLAWTNVELRATVRDPVDSSVIADEARNVSFDTPAPGRPGWVQPDFTDFARVSNVPYCPSAAGRALLDRPLWLDVTVDDRVGHKTTVRREVTVTCDGARDPAACRCLCAPPDGGACN